MVKLTQVAVFGLTTVLAHGAIADTPYHDRPTPERLELFPDPTGFFDTVSSSGEIDRRGAFFQSLGTNGRSCGTCHLPDQAFSLTAEGARETYFRTRGLDPLFAPVDGANCPTARRGDASEHSLVLQHGLFRIGLALPANAQFTISVVQDPYGCAITRDTKTGQQTISVYRRPIPTTNLSFLSDVMSDGRETLAPLGDKDTFLVNLQTDLKQQAADATTGHAQALRAPTDKQLTTIVNFELGLHTAQALDFHAGRLTADGALGGALALSMEQFYPGINDAKGGDPTGAPFDPASMTLFADWLEAAPATTQDALRRDAARSKIAAGEEIFNSANLIVGGGGVAHCASCHDTPNIGNRSLSTLLDVGTSHSTQPGAESNPQILAALGELTLPKLPLYLISGCPSTTDPTQTVAFYTTDPGRALITGKCSDLYKMKAPTLRSLAARAPYFHNGAASDLSELVNFYNQRFQIGLTPEQKSDLVSFLSAL